VSLAVRVLRQLGGDEGSSQLSSPSRVSSTSEPYATRSPIPSPASQTPERVGSEERKEDDGMSVMSGFTTQTSSTFQSLRFGGASWNQNSPRFERGSSPRRGFSGPPLAPPPPSTGFITPTPAHAPAPVAPKDDVERQAYFMEAVRAGDEARTRVALEAGVAVDEAMTIGFGGKTKVETALLVAATKGFTTITRLLLDAGAKVDQLDNSGESALMKAAIHGHRDICALLLQRKAHVNQEGKYGVTPLMLAAERGHETVCRLLLENKANVNKAGQGEIAPLMLAAHGGYEASV